MLKNIRVVPIASESFGVRSMCTWVETQDVKVLLDAGVSLCPIRFGLPPHPKELESIKKVRQDLTDKAEEAEIVTVSHYHYDHHTPSFEDWLSNWTQLTLTAKQIYQGKTVMAKNPREFINYSQRERGWLFQKTGGKYAAKFQVADNTTFLQGETKIRFSPPVYHGPESSELGWVLMTTFECGEDRFVFAPDVQGPMSELATRIILEEQPQLLMIGGPPSYLSSFKINPEEIDLALRNLERIVEAVPTVILEHHFLRDESWRDKAKNVFSKAHEKGHTLVTAAEFAGKENRLLESARKKLFEEDPPSEEFEKWMSLSVEEKKRTQPPL